jgi:O-antigen ligase
LLKGLFISGFCSGVYAYIQKFNFDFFTWNSQTNGVIGTVGNPNFLSSFIAAAFLPSITLFALHKHKFILIPIVITFFLGVIISAQSTQGYIGILGATSVFVLTRLWFISKKIFYSSSVFTLLLFTYLCFGMLNYGPFADYLYKTSVQSRGDFWRSAWSTGIENPIFGVGLDSFKDNYLLYRDKTAADHKFAELADSAHNYFLDFLVFGGFPLAITYLLFIVFTFLCFIRIIKRNAVFDPNLTAIFSAWCVIQAQSVISPMNIVLLIWNFIFSGTAIGFFLVRQKVDQVFPRENSSSIFGIFGVISILLGTLILYPLFRADRVLLNGLNLRDGNMIIESTSLYPKSDTRFNLVGLELLKSNLLPQALEVARNAAEWNPNSVTGWGLIAVNPIAQVEEREFARSQILRLDPFNKEVKGLKF